ncbi:hypothetical protein SCOR_16430 [Sulfidibacter corallicola]|uniref:Flagellar protein FlgJ N-terminal domain-containing protein n=1 Tax=Sulfidibacter corallicola TaxID=2818388 RepID=A0A8A4TYC6_SULCO|nr:hypothetical protein [Sulfidibacter corallicola]QTD53952.1 hypothetical protein J3U87_16000 [Sulfidibacter corallicola]
MDGYSQSSIPILNTDLVQTAERRWSSIAREGEGESASEFAELLERATQSNGSEPARLQDALRRPGDQKADLDEAAKQLEVQLVTFMLKTMDASSPGGGLMGESSQGLGYFRDEFFRNTAEKIVESQGLGFTKSLKNVYGAKELAP